MNVLKVNCKLDKTPSKQRNGCNLKLANGCQNMDY